MQEIEKGGRKIDVKSVSWRLEENTSEEGDDAHIHTHIYI